MALYVGGTKVKMSLGYIARRVRLLSSKPEDEPVFNNVLLKSADGRALKDSGGRYLTAKENK